MILSEGRVVEVDADRCQVWVELPERTSACGNCGSAASCELKSGLLGMQAGPRRFLLENHVHAKLGDRVTIGVADGAVLRATWFSYLLPALLAIAAAGLGQHLADDAGAVVGTVIGLVLGFAHLRMMDRRLRRNSVSLLDLERPPLVACHVTESL